MEYRALGHSGLSIAAVGLGCMNFGLMNDQAAAAAIVHRADAAVPIEETLRALAELESNVAASTWRGSAEELAAIDRICPPPATGIAGPQRR
jgi:aryl-alcohol dehydrogenase-like predicted oxidoreductase